MVQTASALSTRTITHNWAKPHRDRAHRPYCPIFSYRGFWVRTARRACLFRHCETPPVASRPHFCRTMVDALCGGHPPSLYRRSPLNLGHVFAILQPPPLPSLLWLRQPQRLRSPYRKTENPWLIVNTSQNVSPFKS